MENEKLNKTKEEMIKKCKKIGDMLEIAFWLAIIWLVVFTFIGIINSIGILSAGGSVVEIVNEIILPIRNVFDMDTDISEMNAIKETIISIVIIILNLTLLRALSKIFISTSKNETPFSMDNVKNMKKISRCLYIEFFISLFSQTHALGLVYVVAIGGIEYIFRYGYKLQIESDETL